jgi:hypothetical protein
VKFSKDTPLSAIFKGCTCEQPVEKIAQIRSQDKDTWGLILMACEREQIAFLCHLWDMFPVDATVLAAWALIVKRGFFPAYLDPEEPGQCRSFQMIVSAIEAGKELAQMEAKHGEIKAIRQRRR